MCYISFLCFGWRSSMPTKVTELGARVTLPMVHGSGKVDSWQELGMVFSVAPQADVGENKFCY